MTIVSFPGLGLEFSISRVAFSIGGFNVYWYGVIIGTGLLLAVLYAMARSREFGVDQDRLLDVVLFGTVGGVVGARLYYVLFSAPGTFTSFADIIDIRDGGLAFYGAIIGVLLTCAFVCPARKVKFLPMMDLIGMGFLIGQSIGRWGNFFNQEAFGYNTDLPWGMTSSTITAYLSSHIGAIEAHGMAVDPLAPVHPTFLYESIWYLIGFIVIAIYAKHRRFDGEVFLLYFGWNGFGRFFVEGLRTDSLYIGTIRVSQLLAALMVVLSVSAIAFVRAKIKRNNDPSYLIPYGKTEQCAKDLAMLASKRKDGQAETVEDSDDKALLNDENNTREDEKDD